jgi:hypothetical protein
MRTLGKIALTIVLVLLSAVACYKLAYPTYSYRYRMTVDVMVDGVVRSGASVIEVTIEKQPKVLDAPSQISRVRGEAVFVDLGMGRNVTALLATERATNVDYPFYVISMVFGLTFDDRDLRKLADLKGRRDLPASFLPTFVTFSDLNDANTARIVSPSDFEKEFGIDVQFKRIWIEITESPVANGIDKKLLWLGKPLPWRANNGFDTRPFVPGEYRLQRGHFRRGL